MAGDRVGFECADRALFAGAAATFNRLVAVWPADICDHLKPLAAAALQAGKDAA